MVWQLFLAYGILLVGAMGLLGWIVGATVEREALRQIEDRLRGKVMLLREIVRDRKIESLQAQLLTLQDRFGVRSTLIAADGRVVLDSDRDDLENVENHGQRPEVLAAKHDEFGMATRYSTTVRQNMMYVACRMEPPQAEVEFVRVALPLTAVADHVSGLRRLVWTAVALAAALALALAWWLARRSVQPLQDLSQGAAAIAQGGYGLKVHLDRRDEFGILADSFNDMSQRLAEQFARLDQDRQQLRAVLGSMVEGVIAVDAEQQVLFANERAAQLLEFAISQAVGRKLWGVIRHRPVHELVEKLLRGPESATTSLEWSGPGQRSFIVYGAPLPGRPVPGAVLVLHDVTEMRRLERIRQEFVANVSHELKTPLSVIVACAETLQSGGMDDLEHRGRFLERITTQSQRLLALIIDMISLARIESGAEQFEPHAVSLEEAARACLERHQERVKSKQQRLEAVPPAHAPAGGVVAWVDDDALSHILDNLVDNAIKYTPAEGIIQIHWWAENGGAVVEVRDTGIGIPEAELPRIFERFYRVDKARSREMGGTGLGLSIVKHLVQTMNGSVRVVSQPGHGTAFTVTLPQPA